MSLWLGIELFRHKNEKNFACQETPLECRGLPTEIDLSLSAAARLQQTPEDIMDPKRDRFLSHLERLNNNETLRTDEYQKLMEAYVADGTCAPGQETFESIDNRIIRRAIECDLQAREIYGKVIAGAELVA